MSSDTAAALRLCPTRVDGASVLFAHKVSLGQCQDRQRGKYHKCFTCVHNNALAGNSAPGAPANGVALPKLVIPTQRLGLRGRVHAG